MLCRLVLPAISQANPVALLAGMQFEAFPVESVDPRAIYWTFNVLLAARVPQIPAVRYCWMPKLVIMLGPVQPESPARVPSSLTIWTLEKHLTFNFCCFAIFFSLTFGGN